MDNRAAENRRAKLASVEMGWKEWRSQMCVGFDGVEEAWSNPSGPVQCPTSGHVLLIAGAEQLGLPLFDDGQVLLSRRRGAC